MTWRVAHTVAGLAYVALFLGTGAYMRTTLPPPGEMDGIERMLHRSAHVYILLSALINVVAGAHLRKRAGGWRRRLQTVGSVSLLAAPAVLATAFFVEPAPQRLDRPVALAGVALALLGAALHAAAAFGDRSAPAGRLASPEVRSSPGEDRQP